MVRVFCTLASLIVVSNLTAYGQEYRIFINPSSKISVHGSTNVNRFVFKYAEEISIDKPVHVKRNSGVLLLNGCILDLKVRAFDSGNAMMNKDFRKMMNEEENPFITVELSTLKPVWLEGGAWISGTVEIQVEMNQVAKKYTVQCTLENPESLLIHGHQQIALSDFDLVAPSRMMGMIKVSDVVELDLSLRFRTDR